MSSLTETSIIARKFIRYGIYFLIFLISARFLFNTARTIWLQIFPPPPQKPTVAFGNLPKLPFPEKTFPKDLNINVETPEGALPTLATQLPVYQMPPIPQNIKALDEAKEIASKLGFDPNGAPLLESTPSVYRFPKKNSPSSLRMNIITKIFSIDYDILQNPVAVQGVPPNKDEAVNQLIAFVRGSGVFTPDIEAGVFTHQFYKVEVDKFIPVSSQSEANLIKINMFRKNYGKDGKVVSVTPDYPEANIWFMIGSLGTREVVRAEYYYFPIDETKSGTYPLISTQQALDKLKAGNAFLVSFNGQGKNVTIRKIYLAYYDAGQYAEYYQPVVVFEGDDNFRSYVPAVSDDFYGKEESK
jgi:hypothetical protein